MLWPGQCWQRNWIKAAQAAINATIMMNQGGLSEHFGGCCLHSINDGTGCNSAWLRHHFCTERL